MTSLPLIMTKSKIIPRRRFPRSWILKVVGSCLVLGVTLWLLPTQEVWRAIGNIPLLLWGLVLGAALIGHIIIATKWWLVTNQGGDISFPTALRSHYSGLFTNLFLPGVAGTDVVRAGLVLRGSRNKVTIVVGSLMDRIIDSVALLLLSGTGIIFWLGQGTAGRLLEPITNIAIFFAFTLGGLYLIATLASKLPATGIVGQVSKALTALRRRPARLLICLGLSLAVQSAFIALNIALASAGGLAVDVASWYFAWPLAKLMAIVPISIAGLGVREATLAGLLLPFGAAPALVVAAGLLWQTILISVGLVGGLTVLLTTKFMRRAAAEPSLGSPLPNEDLKHRIIQR